MNEEEGEAHPLPERWHKTGKVWQAEGESKIPKGGNLHFFGVTLGVTFEIEKYKS